MEEMTADLEVTAVLKPLREGDKAEKIVLQKNARGVTFVGSFAPKRDRPELRMQYLALG